jgi:hypothetical protein
MGVMEVSPNPWVWAQEHFATAELGDPRRTRRLVQAATKIAAHPEKTFPQIFDWNELRAFYRLCDQKEATVAAVQTPHWEQTRQAMRRTPLTLILHDTTELDYSSHWKLAGVGQIGNERGRGFLQHNSLAVTPQPRQVLGLAFQQFTTRKPAPKKETVYQRKRRQKESDLWMNGIRASGRPPAECCWVDVADRGSDLYEAMAAAREVEHHFLFRASQNRKVFVTPAHDQTAYLLDYARSLPSQGTDTVDITGRGNRPARTAQVQLAAAPVWVPPTLDTPHRQEQPTLAAWVIRIWEPEPPAHVTEPLEWILLCSLPTTTWAELKTRRDWYACRPLVEVYHDVEKNGCSEEDRQFETADRMETCVALLAVRVLQLRCAVEAAPEAPATQVATAAEIRVIRRVTKHKGRNFTVKDFVHGVARLGGFVGRVRDGTPGVRTLWRGYQRLQDMLLGYQLNASDSS